jgi:hypothetical protein
MAYALLKDGWRVIRQKDGEIINVAYEPLAHIEPYLAYFDLSPTPELSNSEAALSTHIDSVDPSFKVVTNDHLFSLRQCIYSRRNSAVVDPWAEKLMRFCEIMLPDLKRRSIEKCGTNQAARLHLLHLATFLMDQSIATQDLRYLNTVLKLMDLKWLMNPKRFSNDFNIALFEFRLVLTTEYAVRQLCEDGSK